VARRRQIVVACRMPYAGVALGGTSYLERARALTRRAEALGAELVAWSAITVAFAWDPELVEEAVALAVTAHEGAEGPEGAWACGIAEGDMERLETTGSRAELAWGPPLVHAALLAREARPGTVLVDAKVGALKAGDLRIRARVAARDLDVELAAAELDPERPWNRAEARASSQRPELLAAPSEQELEAEAELEEPERFAQRMVDLTRHALLSGNARSLERWSEGLKATGEHDALAERMRALARVSRGQAVEALRSLYAIRRATAGQPRTVQCQASLALAFALLAAGLPDEALLEALDALAQARAGGDLKAAGACLAFLAKLYARVGLRAEAERIGAEVARHPRASQAFMAPFEG
jgi:hypothetical protein